MRSQVLDQVHAFKNHHVQFQNPKEANTFCFSRSVTLFVNYQGVAELKCCENSSFTFRQVCSPENKFIQLRFFYIPMQTFQFM